MLPSTESARPRRSAFTLLEIVVTLVVIGLAAALVAPAWRSGRDTPNDNIQTVLSAARELAARRAQPLVLTVNDRGAWRIFATGDSTALASGELRDGSRSLRVRVTPLGACFIEGRASPGFDAIACTSAMGRTP